MSRCSLLLFAAAVSGAASLSLHAVPAVDNTTQSTVRDGNGREATTWFKELDADHDGRLSQAEFSLARPERKQDWQKQSRADSASATDQDALRPEVFTELDQNRDGFLDEKEFFAGQQLLNVRGRLNRDGTRGNPTFNGEGTLGPAQTPGEEVDRDRAPRDPNPASSPSSDPLNSTAGGTSGSSNANGNANGNPAKPDGR